jgi:hypothetical protein
MLDGLVPNQGQAKPLDYRDLVGQLFLWVALTRDLERSASCSATSSMCNHRVAPMCGIAQTLSRATATLTSAAVERRLSRCPFASARTNSVEQVDRLRKEFPHPHRQAWTRRHEAMICSVAYQYERDPCASAKTTAGIADTLVTLVATVRFRPAVTPMSALTKRGRWATKGANYEHWHHSSDLF